MRILITGGCGFIGRSLARRLVDDGHGVSLIDSLSVQIHGDLPDLELPAGVDLVRIDIRDIDGRSDFMEPFDAIFHLAAETGTGQSMYDIKRYVGVNDLGTAALLEGLARCTRRPRRLFLASSRSVYGEGAYHNRHDPGGQLIHPRARLRERLAVQAWEHHDTDGSALEPAPTPEGLAPSPGSVYAATKAAQELLVQSASDALGIRSTIFRLQNVYGAGQSLRNPYTGIISIFFNRARQGSRIPIFEDGQESRDFVHVDDVVDIFSLALSADLPQSVVINVGSGQRTSVLDLASALLAASGLDVPMEVTGEYRVGDIRHCYADIGRARQLLGFVPKISLSAGLRTFCDWAYTQAVYADRLADATRELKSRGLGG